MLVIMLDQPVSAIYNDIGRVPVTLNLHGAISEGRKIPVTANTVQGTASAFPAIVHPSGDKKDHIVVHLENWGYPGLSGGEGISKLPVTVRVWNYVINFFKVTAHVEALRQTQEVMAYPNGTPEDKHVTQLVMMPGSFEDDRIYVTSAAIEKEGEPFVIFRVLPWLYQKHRCRAAVIQVQKNYAALVHFSSTLIRQAHAFVARVTVDASTLPQKIATYIKVRRPAVATAYMLVKPLGISVVRGFGYMFAKIVQPGIDKLISLKVFAKPVDLAKTLVQSMVKVVSPNIDGKISLHVFTMPMDISYKMYTLVRIKRVQLDKVLAYLVSELYWRYVAKELRNILLNTAHSTKRLTRVRIFNNHLSTQKVIVRAGINKFTNGVRVLMQLGKSSIAKYINFWLPFMSKHKHGVAMDIRNKQVVPAKVNLVITNKTVIKTLVEWQVLATLCKGGLNFILRPYSLLYKTLILANLNGTKFTSLLSVQTSGIDQETMVAFNKCGYIKRGLIQWYLHSNTVSNEGYSNEIIFDLGQVEPVGPLPPVPIEEWKGGYVEYPFKGMGHQDTSEAAGYLSPEGDAWVKNVQMVWPMPTELFDGEE